MTERPATYDVPDAIRADLPQQIRGLEVNDPVLTLYGDDWSLTLMCPWEISGPDAAPAPRDADRTPEFRR